MSVKGGATSFAYCIAGGTTDQQYMAMADCHGKIEVCRHCLTSIRTNEQYGALLLLCADCIHIDQTVSSHFLLFVLNQILDLWSKIHVHTLETESIYMNGFIASHPSRPLLATADRANVRLWNYTTYGYGNGLFDAVFN